MFIIFHSKNNNAVPSACEPTQHVLDIVLNRFGHKVSLVGNKSIKIGREAAAAKQNVAKPYKRRKKNAKWIDYTVARHEFEFVESIRHPNISSYSPCGQTQQPNLKHSHKNYKTKHINISSIVGKKMFVVEPLTSGKNTTKANTDND